ncbi:CIC11C00000003557 [Sungouiella intermedia]|uniref:CIC11C00000003557 n=1 Tax=Sungouiella intermedia TaxID=45354 RepID=A0A1L0DXL1_9ASCO|nr:CIC11C00000003557 [[Candida] intermedia]
MYFPLIGRLSLLEWPLLLISVLLTWIEYVSTAITKLLPTPVLSLMTGSVKALYKLTPNPINFITKDSSLVDKEIPYKYISKSNGEIDEDKYNRMSGLLNSRNIQEMCKLFGYDVESRVIRTQDDYLLTVQRIMKPGEDVPRNGKVVYMHHGLLMCSEIWVTMIDEHENLPFILYELGYDVWLGNNRGNKYSHKHLSRPLNSEAFWNFSIDEFALYDIPDSINYILSEVGKEKLTYIGFSQGTAQAFASVSINPELNEKVEKIIAISPATTPHGLYSRFLDILLKSSPNIVYLMFSRKVLMPSVMFWERLMYPPFFDTSIDISNYMLFNWRSLNIDKIQKVASYAHLYSTTSVKTVVHWFQIISSKNFQMYHDETSGLNLLTPISYPLKNIKIPIHLIYGDSDSLVDINVMENQLPEKWTTSSPVKNHEHLDNLWGRDVATEVFPLVLAALGEAPKANGYLE